MKKTLMMLFVATVSVCAEPSPAELADRFYNQGIAAEKAGDPETAKEAFNQALALNPNHAHARYRLGQVRVNAGAIAARGREAKFGEVMIPKIEVDGATLQETIDLLAIVVERESKGKVTPNFVMQDPTGKLSDAKITLKLNNVPARAVMHYMTTQAGAKVKFEEHAIVVSPR
jgi:tetratricopeptide (TPR) repeat protein